MNGISIMEIISIICLLILIVLIIVLLPMIISINKLKREKLASEIMIGQSVEYFDKRIKYNNELLQFIRTIIGSIAILKFRSFQDSHDFTKLTKANLETLAVDVATASKIHLNLDGIKDLDHTILNKGFYDEFIVNTSFSIVKDLFERTINDIDE